MGLNPNFQNLPLDAWVHSFTYVTSIRQSFIKPYSIVRHCSRHEDVTAEETHTFHTCKELIGSSFLKLKYIYHLGLHIKSPLSFFHITALNSSRCATSLPSLHLNFSNSTEPLLLNPAWFLFLLLFCRDRMSLWCPAGLELLVLSNPLSCAFQNVGVTDVSHYAWTVNVLYIF